MIRQAGSVEGPLPLLMRTPPCRQVTFGDAFPAGRQSCHNPLERGRSLDSTR